MFHKKDYFIQLNLDFFFILVLKILTHPFKKIFSVNSIDNFVPFNSTQHIIRVQCIICHYTFMFIYYLIQFVISYKIKTQVFVSVLPYRKKQINFKQTRKNVMCSWLFLTFDIKILFKVGIVMVRVTDGQLWSRHVIRAITPVRCIRFYGAPFTPHALSSPKAIFLYDT